MGEVKRYDAVHIRYEDRNIRYGEGCEVEMVAAQDYDALHAENASLKADRDDQYNMKVKAREQRDKVTALLKAKVVVPDGLLDRIDSAIIAFTGGRASMHVPPEANDVDMVLAECFKMVKSMLADAPGQPPSDSVLEKYEHKAHCNLLYPLAEPVCDCAAKDRQVTTDQLYASPVAIKSTPVVMPERSNERGSDGQLTYEAKARSDCLYEVARLNRSKTDDQ